MTRQNSITENENFKISQAMIDYDKAKLIPFIPTTLFDILY